MDTTSHHAALSRAIADAEMFGSANQLLSCLAALDLAVTIRTMHPDNQADLGRYNVTVATPTWQEFMVMDAYHDSWATGLLRIGREILANGFHPASITPDGRVR